MYTLELEKLTEEQLEAFKIIDKKAAETEVKRRKDSTYSDDDIRDGKIYADLYKSYFYLKPMYDNMRNNDVKKTITQSEVLPIMEKIFRWADQNGKEYEKFEGEPIAESQPKPENKEESVVANVSIPLTVGEPEITVAEEPVWEPGGGAEVEKPEFIQVIQQPNIVDIEDGPCITATNYDDTEKAAEEENLSPVESMTQQKLNEILATIPAVEKI